MHISQAIALSSSAKTPTSSSPTTSTCLSELERLCETGEYAPLAPDEIDRILKAAAKQKRAEIALAEYRRQIAEPVVYPSYTAEQLHDRKIKYAQTLVANRVIRGFAVDSTNEKVFKQLCCYFAGDERFERGGMSLSKGLLLTGGVGCGKTTLMRIFAQNQVRSFHVEDCVEIAMDFAEHGYDKVLSFYASDRQPSPTANEFGHALFALCLDDIGAETPSAHYGNRDMPIEKILTLRYSKGLLTHATTNLTLEEIGNVYGSARLVSRLHEMFNIIHLPGNDRRITN